jgi:hypothetical protein
VQHVEVGTDGVFHGAGHGSLQRCAQGPSGTAFDSARLFCSARFHPPFNHQALT